MLSYNQKDSFFYNFCFPLDSDGFGGFDVPGFIDPTFWKRYDKTSKFSLFALFFPLKNFFSQSFAVIFCF